jgi:hypothetical protein
MKEGSHVLVFSRDQMLLQTRELIPGTLFQVQGAGRIQEAEALIAKNSFDLIVLCHSLSPSDRERVAALIEQQSPQPRLLFLRAAGTLPPDAGSDALLMLEASPYGLLKKAAEILGVDMKAKSHSTDVRHDTAA